MRIFFGIGACLCGIATTTPANAQFSTIINVPPDIAPGLIESDTQMNVDVGGIIPDNFLAGASDGSSTNVAVNVNGGVVGNNFQANSGSTINIAEGTVGWGFDAYSGSYLNITGGSLAGIHAHENSNVEVRGGTIQGFNPMAGSITQVLGGHIESDVALQSGSMISVYGGLQRDILAFNGSHTDLHGGIVYRNLRFYQGSNTSINGSGFKLNGTIILGLESPDDTTTFTLPSNSIITGILESGTVFIAENLNNCSECHSDIIVGSTLRHSSPPPISQFEISDPSIVEGLGLRPGQSLNLSPGSKIFQGLNAIESEINITGGEINEFLNAVDTTVNISSGSIGILTGFLNSVINQSGGTIGKSPSLYLDGSVFHNGVVFNQTGGAINGFRAQSGSVANLFAGTRRLIVARSGSRINISGGTHTFYFAEPDSTTNLYGTHLVVGGVDLAVGLELNETIAIVDRDVILEGLYADGTPFSFDLSTSGRIDSSANFTFTLVPEPGTLILIGVGGLNALCRRRVS